MESNLDHEIPDFVPQNHAQETALNIATTLQDRHNLKFHLYTVYKLGPAVSQRWCGYVMEYPSEKIKKTRAAFYAYLTRLEIMKSGKSNNKKEH